MLYVDNANKIAFKERQIYFKKKKQAKMNVSIANNVGGVREDVDSSDFVGDTRSNETV